MREKLLPVALSVSIATGCAVTPEYEQLSSSTDTLSTSTTPNSLEASRSAVDEYFAEMPHISAIPDIPPYAGGYISSIDISIFPERISPLDSAITERVLGAIAMISGEENSEHGHGSGFLMIDPNSSLIRFVTAGHVPMGMAPDSITVTLNDGTNVGIDYVSTYYNPTDPYQDPNWSANMEDIAFLHPDNPQLFSSRALTGRNIYVEPLRVGEVLHLLNFQENHAPRDPAIYSVIYDGQFTTPDYGIAIGDIHPGVEEDDTRGGASGGVVVDNEGRIVGMSFATINYTDFRPYECGQRTASHEYPIINNQEVSVWINMPPDNGECDRGFSSTTIRQITGMGTFIPNVNVEPIITIVG